MTYSSDTNIFNNLTEQSKLIENQWSTIIDGICDANKDYPHLEIDYFNALNDKFKAAIKQLHQDLQSPTLILATTGTTSSGKSTIVNLLCGADLMPRMAQEMSAGVVYIHHSSDDKNYLKIHKTDGALWECGEWYDLEDIEIREKLTKVMDEFNKSKGINQPATPHIELTYPLACFNNPELLALSSLPKSTQFKLMDLPGLRNHQDNTNAEVIKNCRDALCLVAYNMEETDENRRLELVQQVLEQIKQMGGSPARMLFVLNRIDAFLCDHEADRRRDEHIDKVKTEITGILYKELPEHRDTLDNLTYSPLSSLPALHAQHIKIGSDKIHAADELDTHFNSLIPAELIDDLPRRISAWKDRDFQRISEVVWKNSYGAEFFSKLNNHIQDHFPTLVIPTIVQRFDKEASDAIGEIFRTCYSELNSSQEKYEQACTTLIKQNAELREFLDNSKKILLEPFNELIEGLKKNDANLDDLIDILSQDLVETNIFQEKLTTDKLLPLALWRLELKKSSIGILEGVKQSLDSNRRNFINTGADRLSERQQQRLYMACDFYSMAINGKDESRFDEQLDSFLYEVSEVIYSALINQVNQENSRIHDTVELIMKFYLEYLKNGVERIAPEWNLTVGHYVLDDIKMPEINLSFLKSAVETKVETRVETKYENKIRTVRHWYSLWLIPETESYKESYIEEYEVSYKLLPNAEAIYQNSREQLSRQLDSLVEPFYNMIHIYINDITETIIEEQARVLNDFNNKLEKSRQCYQDDYEKVVNKWQPLYDASQQLKLELSQLTDTRNYL